MNKLTNLQLNNYRKQRTRRKLQAKLTHSVQVVTNQLLIQMTQMVHKTLDQGKRDKSLKLQSIYRQMIQITYLLTQMKKKRMTNELEAISDQVSCQMNFNNKTA